MKNKVLLLSAAILLTFTPMFAGVAKTETIAELSIQTTTAKAVSLEQVQEYMAGFGIVIVGISPITGSENVYARDNKGLNYIVYVTDGIINGWDEVDY